MNVFAPGDGDQVPRTHAVHSQRYRPAIFSAVSSQDL
jgi:hypothetical protein